MINSAALWMSRGQKVLDILLETWRMVKMAGDRSTGRLSACTAPACCFSPVCTRTIRERDNQCHQKAAFYWYGCQTGLAKGAAGNPELQPSSHKSLELQPSGIWVSPSVAPGDLCRQLFLSICNQEEINSIPCPAGTLLLPSV